MFAIYVYNPVVYHLSTLSVSIPRLRSGSKYNLRRNSSTNSNDAVPIAFKNLIGQLNLNHVNAAELRSPFLSNEGRGTPGRHWRQSFVVDSFLNKCDHSINLSPLHNAPMQKCQRGLSFVLNNSFAFTHQVRFFRSQRSIRNESGHTPSFTDRLKSLFITSSPKKSNFMGSGASVDLLKESEKMRLKLAFAEGYEAGKGKASRRGPRSKVVFSIIFVLLLLASFAVIASATGSAVFKIRFNNHVEVNPEEIDVTFDDVKGTDEAKQELKDIVEFLKYPDKFSALGAKLPKGALLVGPPGTGKTLLARAVAGEAGVPFFHASGSEFDEVLVGQGARRVRDLFAAAKAKAPCVIFIDEIDAVGGKRTNSVLHPYANQTINQLLSEMDGFHQNEGVIVLGATNRREDLDRALLRPGRFDVEVHINVPDFTGRKDIFELYLKKIQCKNIDIDVLARGTTGFTGADIENMVNLAALQAAINNAKFVSMNDLENARDKVLMGPARKRCPDDEANEVTAYHEGGHAIVAYFTKDAIPIHKVTIIPRGPSGGHTSFLPKKERYYTRKSEMLASMDAMMGGRAAEELIFGADKITSGAANDLKQATDIATEMVKEFGMSDKIGLRRIETTNGAYISVNEISPSTTELIDQEIKKLLQDSYERAKSILKTHAKEHRQLAEALLKYETLDADDVKAILNPSQKDGVSS